MARLTWVIQGALALGSIAVFVGCGPQSHVGIKSLGVEQPLTCVTCSDINGTQVCWAAGDNSSAFRPALYAPNPGPRARWCMGIFVSKTNPAAVYVWQVQDRDEYLVYEMRNIVVDTSSNLVTGHGKARVLRVNHAGEVLEGLPSPATSSEDDLTFTVRLKQSDCSNDLKATIDELRPVAEKFLRETAK
jgi:hypothetical protein